MPAENLTLVVPQRALRRRDWERVLLDLRSAGCSFSSVARVCNRDVSTVRLWVQGGDPKESDARIVLALYQRYCPDKFAAHQEQFGVVELTVRVVERVDYVARQGGLDAGGSDA